MILFEGTRFARGGALMSTSAHRLDKRVRSCFSFLVCNLKSAKVSFFLENEISSRRDTTHVDLEVDTFQLAFSNAHLIRLCMMMGHLWRQYKNHSTSRGSLINGIRLSAHQRHRADNSHTTRHTTVWWWDIYDDSIKIIARQEGRWKMGSVFHNTSHHTNQCMIIVVILWATLLQYKKSQPARHRGSHLPT